MQTDNLKTQAEVHRVLLEHGLVTVPSVVAWADAVIEAFESPPSAILDLSMALHRAPSDFWSLLGAVAGVADEDEVWRSLCRGYDAALTDAPQRDHEIARRRLEFARRLRDEYGDERPAEALENDLITIEDGIGLARSGIFGDPDAERQSMRDFLSFWGASPGER